jgi:hypothetical protein
MRGVLTGAPKVGVQVLGKVLSTPVGLAAKLMQGSRGLRQVGLGLENMLTAGEYNKIAKSVATEELTSQAVKQITGDIMTSGMPARRKQQLLTQLDISSSAKTRGINQRLGELRVSAAERAEEAAPTTQEIRESRALTEETRRIQRDRIKQSLEQSRELFDPALQKRGAWARTLHLEALTGNIQKQLEGGVDRIETFVRPDGVYSVAWKDGEAQKAQKIPGLEGESMARGRLNFQKGTVGDKEIVFGFDPYTGEEISRAELGQAPTDAPRMSQSPAAAMREFVGLRYGNRALELLKGQDVSAMGDAERQAMDEKMQALSNMMSGAGGPEAQVLGYQAIMSTLQKHSAEAYGEALRYGPEAARAASAGAWLNPQTLEPVNITGYAGEETAPVTDFRSVDEGPLVRGPTGLEEQEAGGRMSRPATVPPVQRGDVPMRAAPTRAAKVGEFSGSEEYITNTLLTGDRNSVEYAEAYVAAREMGILEKIEQQAPQETPTEAEGRVGTRWTLFR